MSDPLVPDGSKDIANRFRRLSDSDEDKHRTQNGDEFVSEEAENEEGQFDNIAVTTKNIQGKIPDNSGLSKLSDELIQPDENTQNQAVEEPIPDELVYNNQVAHNDLTRKLPDIVLPQIDEYGMPLPGRTQNNKNLPMPIGSNRYIYTQGQASGSGKNRNQGMTYPQHPYPSSSAGKLQKPERRPLSISMKQGMGCILRMFLLAALAGIVVILVGGSFVLYEYYNIAATLPSVADLQLRASTFETTRIFDRNGNLLYEILDPTAGRRTFITLDKISPYMVAATIATEDKSFYSHPGFDWTAIVRAFWQNFRGGETISGASTITQQLARGLLFSPEERFEQTYIRKVREALLAAEITRRYTKDQILELYLNEFYYGNLAYGVEAASETYFDVTADKLDLAQASLLAGLPQAPSIYDVYQDRDAVRERQKQVLTLMYEASNEQGCIYVSNSAERICVDAPAAVEAYTTLENYQFHPPDVLIKYPHWVNYVRSILRISI